MKTTAMKSKGICLSPDLAPGHYRVDATVWIQKDGDWIFDNMGAFTASRGKPIYGWPPGVVVGSGTLLAVLMFIFGWKIRQWLDS
jgi:hypothetical protein